MESDEPTPKKAKAVMSAGKVMAIVFRDARDIIHIDYLPPKQTINGENYAAVLSRFSDTLKEKRRKKCSSIKTEVRITIVLQFVLQNVGKQRNIAIFCCFPTFCLPQGLKSERSILV